MVNRNQWTIIGFDSLIKSNLRKKCALLITADTLSKGFLTWVAVFRGKIDDTSNECAGSRMTLIGGMLNIYMCVCVCKERGETTLYV